MSNHEEPSAAEIKKATPFNDLADLNVEQLARLAKFVRRVGGIKNARFTVAVGRNDIGEHGHVVSGGRWASP